jgi:hypothetical protein
LGHHRRLIFSGSILPLPHSCGIMLLKSSRRPTCLSLLLQLIAVLLRCHGRLILVAASWPTYFSCGVMAVLLRHMIAGFIAAHVVLSMRHHCCLIVGWRHRQLRLHSHLIAAHAILLSWHSSPTYHCGIDAVLFRLRRHRQLIVIVAVSCYSHTPVGSCCLKAV